MSFNKSRGAVGATMQGTGLFNNPNYKSTNVAFRGQDKPSSSALGQNPNSTIEDEYISNLQ